MKIFPNTQMHIHSIYNKVSNVEQLIRDSFAVDPLSIKVKDSHGLTPIHIAARAHSVQAVMVLLDLGGIGEDLKTRD